ncbi:hypothetical protein F5Y16DRAFT_418921 [Xylariaceae sp. FL0255]|nr:hypothetical protein F5Y16DRAFT_418921 [Xylariaceae sp. FL0255]
MPKDTKDLPSAETSKSTRGNASRDKTSKSEGEVRQALGRVLNLGQSVDTDRKTHVAPAAIHETVKPTMHEIVKERITRDIHTHDVFRRELPVYDVEVLPARHFILDEHTGQTKEVAEAELPVSCTGEGAKWRGKVESGGSRLGSDEANAAPATGAKRTWPFPDLTEDQMKLIGGWTQPQGVRAYSSEQ